MGTGDEEVCCQDLLNDGAETRQREIARRPLVSFDLQEGVGDGREGRVALPAWERATFKVIETQFVLEFLVLLLDRPPLMGEPDESAQRGGRRQVAR